VKTWLANWCGLLICGARAFRHIDERAGKKTKRFLTPCYSVRYAVFHFYLKFVLIQS